MPYYNLALSKVDSKRSFQYIVKLHSGYIFVFLSVFSDVKITGENMAMQTVKYRSKQI